MEKLSEKSFHMRHILLDVKRLKADTCCLNNGDIHQGLQHHQRVEQHLLDELCRLGYPLDMSKLLPVPEVITEFNQDHITAHKEYDEYRIRR